MHKNGSVSMAYLHASPIRIVFSAVMFICLIINSAMPRFLIGTLDPGLFSKILSAQGAVIEYFTFSGLPMDIINTLFAKQGKNVKSGETQAPIKKDTPVAPADEFSFISVDRVQNIVRNITSSYAVWDQGFVTIQSVLSTFASSCDPPPGARACVFGVFLLCFFLLPRSSVNDAYIAIVNRGNSTRFEKSNRVFYLPMSSIPAANAIPATALNAPRDFIYFPCNKVFELFNFLTSGLITYNFITVVHGGYHEKH